jgi:hypothetical protein
METIQELRDFILENWDRLDEKGNPEVETDRRKTYSRRGATIGALAGTAAGIAAAYKGKMHNYGIIPASLLGLSVGHLAGKGAAIASEKPSQRIRDLEVKKKYARPEDRSQLQKSIDYYKARHGLK